MLQSKWGMHLPRRGDDMPRGGRKNGVAVVDGEGQYSLGSSSVVTLRSHSVMIQSVRSGVTW